MPNPFTEEPKDASSTPADFHDRANVAAQQVFISNSVLQTWLSNCTFSDSRHSNADHAWHANPDANDVFMYLELLQPDGSVDPWTDGNSAALHVLGAFGEVPSFGQYCGIGKAVVHGDATAPIDWIKTFDSDFPHQGLSQFLNGVDRAGAVTRNDEQEIS